MTAVHDVEHPVFDGPILPVDEHDLAELLAGLVVAGDLHPTYEGEAVGE